MATKKKAKAKPAKKAAKKVAAKPVAAKKAAAKKAPAKKAPAKKVPAKKVPAKKVPAKKVPAKKVAAKKVAVQTAAPATRSGPFTVPAPYVSGTPELTLQQIRDASAALDLGLRLKLDNLSQADLDELQTFLLSKNITAVAGGGGSTGGP